MINKPIRLCYMDDNHDELLDSYLDEIETEKDLEIEFYEVEKSSTYKTLLKAEEIRTSSIILTDSQLFEGKAGSLTGEQFREILKQEFGHKKILVLSQFNKNAETSTIIPKYRPQTGDDFEARSLASKEYYDRLLLPKIEKAIKELKESFEVIENLSQSGVDLATIERIEGNIEGNIENMPDKEDIDALIDIFKMTIENYD